MTLTLQEFRELDLVETFLERENTDVMTPREIGTGVVQLLWDELQALTDGKKVPPPPKLSPACLARIVNHCHDVAMIHWPDETVRGGERISSDYLKKNASEEKCGLGIYDPQEGIYSLSEAYLATVAASYVGQLSERKYQEFRWQLEQIVEHRAVCDDPNLVPVANGIFNYATQTLEEFEPEIVFLHKSPVELPAVKPKLPIYTMSDGALWDVESWMESLADSPEQLEQLWKVLGAMLRPTVRWNKCVMLLATTGNNGKGTFCTLGSNLVGSAGCAYIPIDGFSSEFGLGALLRAQLVIGHENATNSYTQNAAAFKAAVTGDVFTINRKNKSHISLRFQGLIVQCVNEIPRFGDKSDSLTRRLLFIPFRRCFEGVERKEIKSDFLGRREVLEYVLWKVLCELPSYDELPVTAESAETLGEWQRDNNLVIQFAEWLTASTRWRLLPNPYIYELYVSWMKKENSSGKVEGSRVFARHFEKAMEKFPRWRYSDSPLRMSSEPDAVTLEYPVHWKWRDWNWLRDRKSRGWVCA